MSHATVCIATHKRRSGLEKLLASLTQQKEAPSFDVVVVDNDSEKSAETIALGFSDKLQLTYLVEPQRGIARARNRAVAATQSPFLAFIDDDEWAPPHWLATLAHELDRSTADAVIGQVAVEFAPEVSEMVRRCGLFDPNPQPDGSIVPWYFTRTSNALVRRAALPDPVTPFLTCFDLRGGEDIHLFKTMLDAGARIVASASAVVYEYRPLARANISWVFRRALRNGGNNVELLWAAVSAPKRLWRALPCSARGLLELLRAAAAFRRDPARAGRHLVEGGMEIGKLLFALGVRIEEYRHHV
jgi:succinoglycan biosynthesis protein ExoM